MHWSQYSNSDLIASFNAFMVTLSFLLFFDKNLKILIFLHLIIKVLSFLELEISERAQRLWNGNFILLKMRSNFLLVLY